MQNFMYFNYYEVFEVNIKSVTAGRCGVLVMLLCIVVACEVSLVCRVVGTVMVGIVVVASSLILLVWCSTDDDDTSTATVVMTTSKVRNT